MNAPDKNSPPESPAPCCASPLRTYIMNALDKDTSPESHVSCCASPRSAGSGSGEAANGWNIRYFAAISALAVLWWLVYSFILPISHWLVFGLAGLAPDSHVGASVKFFIYDTAKILLLLVALIYGIAWIRASLNVERVRDYLAGKRRGLGYLLGAMFGSVTPFCSCSSLPLFLGFTNARIPIGITMSFLITSPLINEIAVVLLWGLFGWKFTVVYIVLGMTAGIIGGFVMDSLNAGRWLQPFILETMEKTATLQHVNEAGKIEKLTVRQRHTFAYDEMLSIFNRVWKWVIIGVGVGAVLHGFVPDNWFAENLGAGEWWTVPVAVFLAIPLY
ncbi:MAG: permease, partial [Holophagales bacterium]|nr:permease [Holophagales bacterium]